ncbi:DUF6261 family protein [Mangrovibacterium lignilyticum]|uniref:DUF6261 family protein n=1 Tax=Mangrovibacterium lignilyticum TaxID=2668052 RepID=UPI0013D7D5E4|nr:DUF6261 family protein [Mangrovibacterium lignilyticum]
MLLKIIYSLYSLMNLSALARKVRNLLSTAFPTDPIVISLLAKIDVAQAVAVQAIGSSTKQNSTAMVRSADTSRDNSYVSLRNHVSAGLRRENADYRAACEALWPLFEKNDTTLYYFPDGEETQAIESLLTELKAGDGPAHLATVNATEWLDELDRDNQAFVAAQQQRAANRSTDTTVTDAEALKQLEAALNLMNSVMDSLSMMEAAGVQAVATELNEYIAEANANARNSKSQTTEEIPLN